MQANPTFFPGQTNHLVPMHLTWPKLLIIQSASHPMIIRRLKSTLGPTESISSLNSKIRDMISKQLYDQTLRLYREELHPSDFHGETSILPSVIKACSSPSTYYFGLQLHSVVLKSGSDSDPAVSNSLISMYAKCSHTVSARKLFDNMPHRDLISYNSLINCYTQNGCLAEGLEVLKAMYKHGFAPKAELLASIVSLCARTGYYYNLGRLMHGLVVVDERIEDSVFVPTALVDFYLKCHDLLMASRVFDRMDMKNEVSWTAMISGCIANRSHGMAIDCFRRMLSEGLKPNRVTLLALLPVFGGPGSVKHGKEIHGYAFRHGFHLDYHLAASLIDMYGSSGQQRPARTVWEQSRVKDVVMWSSMIGSNVRNGDHAEAMKLFSHMRAEGIKPNSVTLLAIISSCSSLCSLNHGRAVHSYIMKSGFNFDIFMGNALINMYSKCGCLKASHQSFIEMDVKDSVSWSSLISGYGLHGRGEEALFFFREMKARGMEVDAIAFLAALSACNHAGLVEEGERFFNQALEDDKISLAIEHYACYIDLLGRSGKVEKACDIVRTMPMKASAKIWSSLVAACKVHGRLEIAKMLADKLIKSEPENAANHTLLSMIDAQSGNWLRAEEVRRLMRENRLNKIYGFSRIELEK